MNTRNGIPILEHSPTRNQNSIRNQKKSQVREFETFRDYVEMAIKIDGQQTSVIMPAKGAWIKQYQLEGWRVISKWSY